MYEVVYEVLQDPLPVISNYKINNFVFLEIHTFFQGCYSGWMGPDWVQPRTQSRTAKPQSHHYSGEIHPHWMDKKDHMNDYILEMVPTNWRKCPQIFHLSSFLQVNDIWLYTSNFDSTGRITDTCRGDSGGPLFIERNGQVELVGVLKVTLLLHPKVIFGWLFSGGGFWLQNKQDKWWWRMEQCGGPEKMDWK